MDRELKQYFDDQFRTLATKDDLRATNDKLKATNKNLENLKLFIGENMVTKQELSDLREELPTKEDFNSLQTSMDGIAKQFKDTSDEVKILGHQISRMEGWVKEAAPKLDVEYKL
jgi:hypothetical protein